MVFSSSDRSWVVCRLAGLAKELHAAMQQMSLGMQKVHNLPPV